VDATISSVPKPIQRKELLDELWHQAPVIAKSHHSRRARERSCDSMTDSSSCAVFNPARPLLELLMGSLSIRRFAAAARSRARFKSATVCCRGSGRVRFLRGRFAALLPRMSCFPVATCRSNYPANTHFDACLALVHEAADHRFVVTENSPELTQPRSLVCFRSTTAALPP
jgi:hypothetical protein